MTKSVRWWLIAAALGMIAASLADSPAFGCWRRFGLFAPRQSCPPLIVEPIVVTPAKIIVKDPPLPAVDKDLRVNVKNIATLLKQGRTAGATKLAQAVAVSRAIDDFTDLEQLYRSRKMAGLGWGSTPAANPALDGLENRVNVLARGIPAAPYKHATEDEESAYWIAAMGEMTIAMAPKKDRIPGKTRERWLTLAKELRDAGLDLASYSEKKNLPQVNAAAKRVMVTCHGCHVLFKDG